MTKAQSRAATALLGASIPRSGHGHLARLTRRYFGDDLKYCSAYDVPDCCRTTPCSATGGRPLAFQKSHDFAFRLPTDVAGALYLIQHRRPVPNALSGAELRSRRRGMKPASAGLAARWTFYDFLAERLAYYKRFHDKWIVAPPARSLIIGHTELEADPGSVLRAIAKALGREVDEKRLAATCDRLVDRGGGGSDYKPRKVEESPFFDRASLAAYEAAVVELCPAFGFQPTLGGANWRRHPIWALARLRHEFGKPQPTKRTAEFD